jgi:nitroreductase
LDKEIPEDVLNQILEAGRQAPSAVNRQPYHFVIVTDSETKKQMKRRFSGFLEKAPTIIVGCANTKSLLSGKWAVTDMAIALQNMVLVAWSLGVGSCWVGSFNENKTKDALNIPKSWKIVALIALGYPAEQPKAKKRKPVEKLFSYNKF